MNRIFKIAGVSMAALTAAIYASSLTPTVAQDANGNYNFEGFSKVELSSSADMDITIGNGYSVEVTGDKSRIENTIIEVKNDTLIVRNKERFFGNSGRGDMLVTVVMPEITDMEINGSGDAEVKGVNNEELELSINGSGNLNVIGKSETLEISINGSGDIAVDEVAGYNVDVSINGSGNVEFGEGACQELEIDIHGSGDVDAKNLKCQDVNVDVAGSGNSVVYASNSITFDSYGSGDVDVYGKPKTVVDNEARRRSKINIK